MGGVEMGCGKRGPLTLPFLGVLIVSTRAKAPLPILNVARAKASHHY